MQKINLELKHYCGDFIEIRKVLKKLGAKKQTVKQQKDYFFALPLKKNGVSPRLKLRLENNTQTLIYYERPDFSKDKKAVADVTLYTVRDNKLLSFLQKSLGHIAIVEKKREVWKKANTVFNLDTVKGVGNIFEIELQKKKNITGADRKLFAQYQLLVLPFLGKIIKGSNVDLVAKK